MNPVVSSFDAKLWDRSDQHSESLSAAHVLVKKLSDRMPIEQ